MYIADQAYLNLVDGLIILIVILLAANIFYLASCIKQLNIFNKELDGREKKAIKSIEELASLANKKLKI